MKTNKSRIAATAFTVFQTENLGFRAGQVRKLVRKSANPQLRTNKKSCGHADLRTLAVEIADLRLRTILNFSPQFRKFYTNIEIPFYFCKIFMFLPSQTLDINLIFSSSSSAKISSFSSSS